MTFIRKHFFLISLFFLFNLILSISSYFIFNNYSYDGPTRVFKNFYEVYAERNFEFADLDILTSQACFPYCKFFEKNIENKYLSILQKEAKKRRRFEYTIKRDEEFDSIFFNRILIEQRICIDEKDCISETETIFKSSILSLDKYLKTHIDELISLTNYNQNNKIYDLVIDKNNEREQDFEKRVEAIATKIVSDSEHNITADEAVQKAKNIVLNIKNDLDNPETDFSILNQNLKKLLIELENFKMNRLSKIPSYYKIKFVESKDWEGGLKESPFREIYYNIPNIIKSLFIFIILLIFSLIFIRIINRFKLN